MNPLRLTATNYRCFDTLDVELPVGVAAIAGSNGAGKSSIVNAIDTALFGSRSRSLADDLMVGEQEMEIALEFEHRGETYRVRRSYSARGRGVAKVDFEVFDRRESWEPLTRETAKETDAAVCALLGLSRETFRASAFLAQGDGAAFTEAQPRDRKAILAEILGLSLWDELHVRVGADRRAAESSVAVLSGKVEVAEHELLDRADVIAERDASALARDEAKAKLEEAEQQQADAEERLRVAREIHAARESSEQLLAAKRRERETISERLDALGDLDADIRAELLERGTLEASAAMTAELDSEAARARAASHAAAERARLTSDLGVLSGKIAVISSQEEALCPTCGQHVDAQAKATALARLEGERTDLESRLAELPGSVDTRPLANVEHDLDQARRAERELVRLAEREKQLTSVAAEVERLQAQVPALDADIVLAEDALASAGETDPPGAVANELDIAQRKVAAWRHEYDVFDRAVVRSEERLERLARIESELAETREQIEAQRKELDILAILERAFGRDGIPALIVENAACPQIEVEANRILAELGTAFTVELRTQRALKTGEGLREALDIIVSDGTAERPYETFSGGERTRLNLSLRIALARLLAHRRGAEVRMLVIDEPEFLDEAGHERLADVLRGLLDDFDRVLLVSHAPTLRDSFDQTLTVVKDGDRSRVLEGTASDSEMVAA